MSGKASRSKGMRGEYIVRDYFRQLGAEAHRVPLSGASQGFKGDVQVTFPGGKPFYVEVKKRRKEFDTVYKLVATVLQELGNPSCVRLVGEDLKGYAYAIGQDFREVRNAFYFTKAASKAQRQLEGKLIKMCDKWLEGCDYLVIQGDRKPLLFIMRV